VPIQPTKSSVSEFFIYATACRHSGLSGISLQVGRDSVWAEASPGRSVFARRSLASLDPVPPDQIRPLPQPSRALADAGPRRRGAR
jgi:hypothetical protein